MPLFEYKCPSCKRVEEVLCSFKRTKSIIVYCDCKRGMMMEKQFSACNNKVWHYEPWRMDADADRKKAGMEI